MTVVRLILIFVLESGLLALAGTSSSTLQCPQLLRQYLSADNDLLDLLQAKRTILVAHGKSFNQAPESSWRNLLNSIESAQNLPLVLEMDLQMTRDHQFIIAHDPTFHRLAKNYQTSPAKKQAFWREALGNQRLLLAAQEAEGKGDFVFYLFDSIRRYSLQEIKSEFWIYDHRRDVEIEVLSLGEVLQAFQNRRELKVPTHLERGNGIVHSVKSRTISLSMPLQLYFDFKTLNSLARRYSGLSDWDWIKRAMTDEELEAETSVAITEFSKVLKKHRMHDRVLITVRHPQIMKMVYALDPEMQVMMSSDRIQRESSAEEFIKVMNEYLEAPFKRAVPRLIEVKYLPHILNKDIRYWARKNNLRLFYNAIKETDALQFEGKYAGSLPTLLSDIFYLGSDLWIQTNTVEGVAHFLLSRPL